MTPSRFQREIFDFAARGDGSAVIEAVAGSGKTRTLIEVSKRLKGRQVFLAFNRSVADELKGKVREAHTLNGIGFRALAKRSKVDADKVAKMIPRGSLIGPEIKRLVSGAKAFAMLDIDAHDIESLCDYFDMDFSESEIEQAVPMVGDILKRCVAERDTVDFDDQVWLPVIENMALPQYDAVMVDEAQDLSLIQRAMLHKLCAGRMIAAGDTHQAIYAWRGADAGSMQAIRDEFRAVSLPLSITYRCPVSVTAYAQALVPEIAARSDAPDGAVLSLGKYSHKDFRPGDLIICRNNAPLTNLAYRLMAQNVPAGFTGRDMGRDLLRLVERVGQNKSASQGLTGALTAWRDREVARHIGRGQDARAASVQDRYEALMALAHATASHNAASLLEAIKRLYEAPAKVMLSTIHRAKGLEARRVWWLDPQLVPAHWARTAEAVKQESNLAYVAITRSSNVLVHIRSDGIQSDTG